MKNFIPVIFLALSFASANDIVEYHDEFRFLLRHTENLINTPKSIDRITPNLQNEIQLLAAVETKASSELIYTSVSMLLHQHASLVAIYSKTRHFDEKYILPSIDELLKNTHSVRVKSEKYINIINNPELFQEILNLHEIVKDIENHLGKYSTTEKTSATNQ